MIIPMKRWVYSPQSGGQAIPAGVKSSTIARAEAYAKQQSWHDKIELQLVFRGQFCYLNARGKNEQDYSPLGRLRYFREDNWSFAFYTYGTEKYVPCLIGGNDMGTIEQGIDACSVYLM
jgi:hypothetical protein